MCNVPVLTGNNGCDVDAQAEHIKIQNIIAFVTFIFNFLF